MNAPTPPEAVEPLVSQSLRDALIGAGIFAILSLVFMKDQSWKLALAAIATGLALAYFGTGVIAQVLHVGAEYYGVIGCGCGFLGLTVLGIVMKTLQIVSNDPIGTLQKLVPFFKKGDGQ